MAPLRADTPNRAAMLRANKRYASLRPRDVGKLEMAPAKKYLVVTCIDARIDPAAAFGINIGDAHVIRNAGGSCVAALRDIIISTHFLGVKEVFIIKHKDCGMTLLNSQDKPILQQLYPEHLVCAGASSIADMPWYEFDDPHDAVRRDWWFVQNHPAIRAQDPTNPGRDIIIHGLVYDPVTGKLDEVRPRVNPATKPIPGSQPNGDDDPACCGPTPKPPTATPDGKRLPTSEAGPSTAKKAKTSGAVSTPRSSRRSKSTPAKNKPYLMDGMD